MEGVFEGLGNHFFLSRWLVYLELELLDHVELNQWHLHHARGFTHGCCRTVVLDLGKTAGFAYELLVSLPTLSALHEGSGYYWKSVMEICSNFHATLEIGLNRLPLPPDERGRYSRRRLRLFKFSHSLSDNFFSIFDSCFGCCSGQAFHRTADYWNVH